MPNEVPVVFYNGSDYDYYVIIKNWMSWAKYKKVLIFSISIEKEVINIDKDGNKTVVTTSYKIKFIDSTRFMATSLSNLVDILT